MKAAERVKDSPAAPAVAQATGVMTPLKEAFQSARLAGKIEMVLPTLRKTELYVIVAPDPADGDKVKLLTVPSPKEGRRAVTASESLDTLQEVSFPKRRMTGAQLLAELAPGTEIVIAYPDGGDYLTREQLQWLEKAADIGTMGNPR